VRIELQDVRPIGSFEFRWPMGTESFDHGWEGTAVVDGRSTRFRHGIGGRHAYGRHRVHTVTWLDGQPVVEGVEADDYERSRALLSRIRRADGKMARTLEEVPSDYEDFEIVTHHDEIDAPYSPWGLAVKVREDDVEPWARLAVLRVRTLDRQTPRGSRAQSPPRRKTPADRPPGLDPIPWERKLAVARELIRYEEELNGPLRRGTGKLAEDPEADRFVHEDGFAFLLAVLFDQQVQYGRAWSAPLELKRRLGHLDPRRMLREPDVPWRRRSGASRRCTAT